MLKMLPTLQISSTRSSCGCLTKATARAHDCMRRRKSQLTLRAEYYTVLNIATSAAQRHKITPRVFARLLKIVLAGYSARSRIARSYTSFVVGQLGRSPPGSSSADWQRVSGGV